MNSNQQLDYDTIKLNSNSIEEKCDGIGGKGIENILVNNMMLKKELKINTKCEKTHFSCTFTSTWAK
jgi:hypothetical protein